MLSMIASFASAIGVSWYASKIINDYFVSINCGSNNNFCDNNVINNSTRHSVVYGYCLYLGWVAMGLSFIASLIFILTARSKIKGARENSSRYNTRQRQGFGQSKLEEGLIISLFFCIYLLVESYYI